MTTTCLKCVFASFLVVVVGGGLIVSAFEFGIVLGGGRGNTHITPTRISSSSSSNNSRHMTMFGTSIEERSILGRRQNPRRQQQPIRQFHNSVVVSKQQPQIVASSTMLYMSSSTDSAEDSSSSSSSALSYPFGETFLSDAFNRLDTTDQYDAVLTGLCAKILDTGGAGKLVLATPKEVADEATSPLGTMEQPLKLLDEMNQRNIVASARSLSALIDTAATTENVRVMKLTLSLCMKNSANLVSQYGYLQTTLEQMPSTGVVVASSSSGAPNGSSFFDFVTKGGGSTNKKEISIFETLDDVPFDERLKEVTSATLFLGTLSICFLGKGLLPLLFDRNGDYTFLTTVVPDLVTFTVLGGFILDNFYDGIQTLLNIALSKEKRFELPPKDKLPLGIGSGTYTKTIVAGLNRMFTVDTERQCESEAAAFFTAYTLGLPCFAFQPNALEAAIMMFESMKEHNAGGGGGVTPIQKLYQNTSIDPLMSSNGLLKILVWLMSPVAMEQMNHPQLIVSDPNEASGLLKRLKQKALQLGVNVDELTSMGLRMMDQQQQQQQSSGGDDVATTTTFSTDEINEETLLLKWSYNEAAKLLRQHKSVIKELSQQLAGGTATVGDCVATIEGW